MKHMIVVRHGLALMAASSVVLAVPAPLAGQKSATGTAATGVHAHVALPAAKELVSRYVKAIGGRDALLKHTSRVARGTIEFPAQGMRAELETHSASPNRTFVKMTIPGVGEVMQGYDGTVGWAIDPMQGPMLLQGKQLAQIQQQAKFYAELHDPKDFTTMETVELADFEGARAYKVRLVRSTGEELFEYFSAETGLLVGTTVTQESPMGPITATTTIGDYKSFGGITTPTRMVTRLQGQEMVATITAVEFDTVLPSVFELPVPIKALVTK